MFDLGSTHGCKVNRKKIEPRKFVKVNIGDIISFGMSTRIYVLSVEGENIMDEIEELNQKKAEKLKPKRSMRDTYTQLKAQIDKERQTGKWAR